MLRTAFDSATAFLPKGESLTGCLLSKRTLIIVEGQQAMNSHTLERKVQWSVCFLSLSAWMR